MSKKPNNVKLGVFIISGTTILVVMLMFFGAGAFLDKGVEYETYFDTSVQGLDVGSPVKFRGVQIGKVTEIAFVGDYYETTDAMERQLVLVRMETEGAESAGGNPDADQEELIRGYIADGMRLRLASSGISGLSYIQADYLDVNSITPPIKISWEPGPFYIPSAPSQFGEITQSIESIARDLEDAELGAMAANVDELIQLISERVEEVNMVELAEDVRAGMDGINSTVASLEEFVTHPDMQNLRVTIPETVESINATLRDLGAKSDELLAELSSTLEETKGVASDVRARVNAEEVDAVLASAELASETMPRLVEDLDRLLARADALLVGNGPAIEETIASIQSASIQLEELAELLRQYPAAALRASPPQPLEVYEDQ